MIRDDDKLTPIEVLMESLYAKHYRQTPGSKLVSQAVASDIFLPVIFWRMSLTSAGSSGIFLEKSCTNCTVLTNAFW